MYKFINPITKLQLLCGQSVSSVGFVFLVLQVKYIVRSLFILDEYYNSNSRHSREKEASMRMITSLYTTQSPTPEPMDLVHTLGDGGFETEFLYVALEPGSPSSN